MTAIRPGDLVVLRSGGPTMTVDSVNTSIFDDNVITGVVCTWFVGDRLERVRFGCNALEPAGVQQASSEKREGRSEVTGEYNSEVTGEYKTVLDEMMDAMNTPAEAERDVPRKAVKRPRTAPAAQA